jgi:aminopeptidase N
MLIGNKLLQSATLAAAVTSCVPEVPPIGHSHYDIAVTLDPATGFIAASVDLSLQSATAELKTMSFYLHKQFSIASIDGDLVSGFRFDKVTPSDVPWMPEAGAVQVMFERPLNEAESVDLHFEYSGVIDAWPPWSANVITQGWTEMGLYLPWYPYNYDESGPFTFDVNVITDAKYQVRGFGLAERTDRGWHLKWNHPTNDIVLVASRDLETKRIRTGSHTLQVHYTSIEDSVAESVAEQALSVLDAYEDWFGAVDLTELGLVESKRELGGGYARPGLIVLSDLTELTEPERHADFLRFLGHEIGHLWWRGALTSGWEDWLNESFAEYSALLLLRNQFGEDEFQTRLAQKRGMIDGTAPIWGFERGNTSTAQQRSEVETILYSKGPLLLHELAERVGRSAFLDWCHALVDREIRTTDGALALLREQEGAETGQWFEDNLRRR